MAEALRLLILDDRDGAEILGAIVGGMGGAHRLLKKHLATRFQNLPPATQFDPDVAIFDYLLSDSVGDHKGLGFLMAQAQGAPSRLCMLKSSTQAFTEIETKQLKDAGELPNLRVSTGLRWDKGLRDGLVDWIVQGGAKRRLNGRYKIVKCASPPEPATFELAAEIVAANWEAETPRLDAQLAAATLLGRLLALETKLPQKLTRPYLTIETPLDARLVPWEFMLLETSWALPMDTPIVRLVDTDQPRVEDLLQHMLFVHGPGTNWESQFKEAERCLGWRRIRCEAISMSDFVAGGFKEGTSDIVHIAMHNNGPSRDEINSLEEAIVACSPKIVVFAACDSARMLTRNRGYSAKSLFARGVDTLVSTQFLLEETTLDGWVREFYSHLAVFHEVGIAAAAARQHVADRKGRLWEMATIVTARENSPFVL